MKIIKSLCLYLAFSACGGALACDKLLKVASHDAFWPPYVIGTNGVMQGKEVDALGIIFNGSPFCFDVKLLPNSKRALSELRHGRFELIWAASYTDYRAQFAHYTTSYRTEVMRLYENANNPHEVTSLADIFAKGYVVGANFGSYYGEEFERFKTTHKSQIMYTSAATKRFEMLNKQRIDFAVDDELVGAHFSKKVSNIKAVENIGYVNKSDIHFLLSKKIITPAELKTINQLINSNKAELNALFE
ncbi:polar amino acid transport system substrate-binding protein [Pseudoalteromonas espejiana DSM 9414]|uniref:Uncharacterized protein n=1 Tax=Pseudoalteromonas espejiana TaxID=28107 RepID=A0A510XVC4_9GAMM|nr:transporter substrate-binding domain-containing protein [Pseudoalteromonas espejiana]ASM51754.1 polar amino acid transport system substrate-binding protein [Pseudoalteromonas espejiana DSM 9414]GEK54982.1 hypothetical protein PES01_18270 [Pseudoalteromonas espejiana]